MFMQTHPIIGTRDIKRAIDFYTRELGFELVFADHAVDPNYVGFRRNEVEVHMQFQYEHEMREIRLRFLVDDPDRLYSEYQTRGVAISDAGIRNTPWKTREFGLYDNDRNALSFYRHLHSNEV